MSRPGRNRLSGIRWVCRKPGGSHVRPATPGSRTTRKLVGFGRATGRKSSCWEMTPHNLAKNEYVSLTALITTDRGHIPQTAAGKHRDSTPQMDRIAPTP